MTLLTEGHRRSLRLLEQTEAVRATLAAYEGEIGHPVYLRPTDNGLTVISLDPATRSMIGVGGANCSIRALPPTADAVRAAVVEYRAKIAAMKRESTEERFVLSRIRRALEDKLRLRKDLLFLHQELRFANANKIDVLAVDPTCGQLVVVEAKESDAAVKRDGAGEQAAGYVAQIAEHADELHPFLARLASALARVYRNGEDVTIDRALPARWEVWWPRGTILGPRDRA